MPLSGRLSDGIPRCLLIGRCIEVWSNDGGDSDPYSTTRRFQTVRRYVLDRIGGVRTADEEDDVIPRGSAWSAGFTMRPEQQVGRSGAAEVAERFALAGCTLHDLPRLRDEAEGLLIEAEANPPTKERKAAR